MEQVLTPPPMTFEQAMAIIEKRNEIIFAKIEIDKKLHQEEMS